ncbi:MAG: hypothetical protein NTX44_13880 [Ignavibacteriales bacterium]|nr:hypothetical protein [Ignavibacteriales bacterium]
MAKPQRVTILKANIKDQPGTVLGIMKDLKSKNIALKSLWGSGKSEGAADLYAIAKDPDKLRNAWKASGVFAEEGTGIFITGVDKTGVLLKSLEALAQANVSMKALIAIAVSGKYGSIIWVDAMDVEKAAQVLGAK